MSYAEWYQQHKAEWDEESSRRQVDRILKGRKTPEECDVIKLLKPVNQKAKGKSKNE